MNQPAFQGIDVVYKGKADNKDIRDLLEKLVPKATEQMKDYAKKFKGSSDLETSKKIFNFLKNDLSYIADGQEQIIKLPSALLKKKVGDCKSYALFTASVLENLGIPYVITYTSYNENPIPHHVYIVTKNGIIIDAVYGIFNKEKKANYKYTKNMNVRYMAGMGSTCGCGGKCGCKSGMGNIVDDLKAKRDQAANYAKEKQQQLQNYAREQEAKAKALRDKALADAKALRDKIAKGGTTIGLAPGRALFMLMIENNFDGFATKLSQSNTNDLLNGWYKLGGDRTKLAKALKSGTSKPSKKLGFLPKLNAIYNKAGINGMGAVDPNEKAQTLVAPASNDSLARQQANAAIEKYKMDGSIQGLIGGLCTSVGTIIGTAVGPPHGTAIGAGAGASLGTIVIALTPVIVNAVRKTPKTENPDQALTPPAIDPTSKNNLDDELEKPSNQTKDNTLLYIGGAGLLAGAIYFATKK
jgi:hypothetical protein